MSELIRREDAIEALIAGSENIESDPYLKLLWAIEAIPAVDAVEVRHGLWKPHPIYPKEWDVCTSCGLGTKRREYGTNPDGTEWRSEVSYTYCPWCGAKMDEVTE